MTAEEQVGQYDLALNSLLVRTDFVTPVSDESPAALEVRGRQSFDELQNSILTREQHVVVVVQTLLSEGKFPFVKPQVKPGEEIAPIDVQDPYEGTVTLTDGTQIRVYADGNPSEDKPGRQFSHLYSIDVVSPNSTREGFTYDSYVEPLSPTRRLMRWDYDVERGARNLALRVFPATFREGRRDGDMYLTTVNEGGRKILGYEGSSHNHDGHSLILTTSDLSRPAAPDNLTRYYSAHPSRLWQRRRMGSLLPFPRGPKPTGETSFDSLPLTVDPSPTFGLINNLIVNIAPLPVTKS